LNIGLVMMLAGCAATQQQPDAAFSELASQLWQAEQQLNKAEPGRLTDMSPEALATRNKQRLGWQKKLQQVDVTKLSEQNQINHAILSYRLADDIDEYRYGAHLMPLTSESGFHTSLGFLPQRATFRSVNDYQLYIQQLSAIPRYMQQQTTWMQQGLATGITQPKAVLKGFEQSIISYITDPEQSVFFQPFKTKPAYV